MREIKFRAWDKETRQYLTMPEINDIVINHKGFVWRYVTPIELEDATDRYDIEWYTGLKDKNGKDLDWWEGDVFKMHGHSSPWVIVKKQGCFWFSYPITKERKLCYRVAEYSIQPVKLGNIYENPELLTEIKR